MARTASGSETSHGKHEGGRAPRVIRATSSAAARSRASERDTRASRAPASASAFAVASPMPDEAPVTSATRPASERVTPSLDSAVLVASSLFRRVMAAPQAERKAVRKPCSFAGSTARGARASATATAMW